MSELSVDPHFLTEGLQRQVTAAERTALAAQQSAQHLATIKTILVVWVILFVLGVAFSIVALMG